jgi:hypothetical protein
MPDAYIQRTREFFGVRAATWDTKFGHDMPAYAAAILAAGLVNHLPDKASGHQPPRAAGN